MEHEKRELAVFLLGPDRIFVLDNTCPHAGGNLSGGSVDGAIVSCPWHQWKFDLTTGICVDSPHARTPCYPARIRDGWVEVSLELGVPRRPYRSCDA